MQGGSRAQTLLGAEQKKAWFLERLRNSENYFGRSKEAQLRRALDMRINPQNLPQG